jgi:hypothetical protein
MRQNSSDQVCQSEVPVWFTGEFTSRTHQSGWLVEFTSALISQASVEGASRTHQIQQAEVARPEESGRAIPSTTTSNPSSASALRTGTVARSQPI